jgi:UDP-galactopyranose mutase
MFKYLIIGSGIAGSVMANKIATQLNEKVLIVEKKLHIGGNCYDYKDENNIFIHKYGPHLFHTNDKNVMNYLEQFGEWEVYHHHVKAMIDGKKVPIPFNLNTLYEVFPNTLAKTLEEKLLYKYDYNSKVPILELKKSTDKELQFLADFVYEKIFVHYTAKQWGMKPEDMDGAVTARVPIFVGKDDRYFNDIYQAVPKDGYTKIFENMLDNKNIKLMLNTSFKEVCEIKNDGIYFMGNKFEGKVIYTGQIDELFDMKFGELPYRSVNMIFESVDSEQYQEVGTVNYPNNYDFTRITEFKHIHPSKSDRTTILKEYPREYKRGENIPYYPIFTDENQKKYNEYLEYSKKYKTLILLGRLAEYKYYDMDDMVARALEVFDKKVKNG